MKIDLTFKLNDDIVGIFLDMGERILEMSQAMDNLTAKVTAMETVVDGMIALLTTIKIQLDEAIANNDTEAINALSERITADTEKYATAVAENTPTS